MATVTIRNVPESIVERVKRRARAQGHSMEQELRELLERSYPEREACLRRILAHREAITPSSAEEIDAWLETGRA